MTKRGVAASQGSTLPDESKRGSAACKGMTMHDMKFWAIKGLSISAKRLVAGELTAARNRINKGMDPFYALQPTHKAIEDIYSRRPDWFPQDQWTEEYREAIGKVIRLG